MARFFLTLSQQFSPVKAPKQFPVVVRTGSVSVKIYRTTREKDGSEYTSYTISYTAADGKRKLKAFADYGEAYEEARAVSLKLAQGEIQVAQLTAADRRSYGHALAELKPTGAALESAAKEYAEAIKVLGVKRAWSKRRDFMSRNTRTARRLKCRRQWRRCSKRRRMERPVVSTSKL